MDWPAAEWKVPVRASGASIVSTPASGNTYRRGETIDIAVDFTGSVTVTGTPELHLALGNDAASLIEQTATYSSGSGTTRLVFRYTVAANIVDTSGLQLYSRPVRVDRDNYVWSASDRLKARTVLSDWLGLSPRQNVDGRNRAPEFTGIDLTLSIPETLGDLTETNARNIGTPATATDADSGDTITYSLEGSDAAHLAIDPSTGQVSTKVDETYDHESKTRLLVTVKADDGNGGTDTAAVSIAITDVNEPPLVPDSPSLSRTTGTDTSLDVSWSAPSNTGRPPIRAYDLQYRDGPSGDWVDLVEDLNANTSTTLTGLRTVKSYQVRVRAANDEGDGEWSAPGSERANVAPMFGEEETSRRVAETEGDSTEAAPRNLGAVVTATDTDRDTLSYSLGGVHRSSFAIDASSGQITTKAGQGYDHEVKSQYRVIVKATDGFGGTARVKVKITVSDVEEPPLAPAAPTVSRISGSATGLDVSWTEPNNTGRPEIEHYDLQYKLAKAGTDWTDGPQDVAGTSSTITGLSKNTRYRVRVRAVNEDGDGEWSDDDALRTAANSPPTASNRKLTVAEDGSLTLIGSDFGFSDGDSGDVLASVKIVTVPGAGEGRLTKGLDTIVADTTMSSSALHLGSLLYRPPANANGSGFASFTFKVSDGTVESTSSYTMTFDVTAVNDAPTGLPTISGTSRVGQLLTADVSAIADVDGLPAEAAAFTWQWRRVDGSTETAIERATSQTYRLVADDVGKKLKVRVSFTDLGGTNESLTSAAYPASGSVGQNTVPMGADGEVSATEDTDYAFAAADFNFSDSDTGDALASVKIATLPGSGKGKLALDGAAVVSTALPKRVTRAELDAGKLKYSPPANENGDDYASFTFKVSDGAAESASSYTMTVDVTAVNDAATGLPTISGTARVGHTLTADVSAIADDTDGLPEASTFTYQWLRVSGGSDTAITGATSQTYLLAAADAGKQFKVTVGFTDLDGHAEALTSEAYPADRQVAANDAPTGADKTVTLAEDGSYTFKAADFGFTDTDTGDALASVKITALPGAGKGSLELDGTAVTANGSVTKAELDAGNLVYTPPADANGDDYASFAFKVSDGTAESAASYTMTLDVSAVNDPATGLPTISGTARVGQLLTAGVSAIADDADGLPEVSTFTWQWLRASGGTDTAISGATSQTYTVAAADAGKKFKVTVSFTDLDGHPEALTSVAYPADRQVAENAAPTGSDKTVTLAEDGSYTFKAADFGFTDTDTGDALASVKITALPGAGKGTLTLDGRAVTANGSVTKAELDAGNLVYTPPANANGTGYASFAFKVSDGTAESAASYTVTLDVSAANDPATGLPTISGTARVGQLLTAGVSAIADDADGLPEVSTFTWQWLRASGGTDTAISGATSQTYTVAAADAGKKFKVTVSFTDLDGHPEALTSVAYPADRQVSENAAPTGSDKTVTLAEDGSYTFKAADFGFTDTDTGDALASVKITALPGAGKGSLELDGTAVTANGSVTKAELDAGDLVYEPPANANGDDYASFRLQGERRDGGERGVLHGDARRDGCERPRDGAADDLGDGAGGPDPDGGGERDRGRCGRPAGGLDFHLAVAAGVGRDRHGDLGGNVADLHGGGGGRGEEVQGDGELHRPRRPPRGAHQRGLPGG